MQQPYSEAIEQAMKTLYDQLSEKDRRLYTAAEVKKLPRGGQRYIAALFGCAPKMIRRGQRALAEPAHLTAAGRIRHPGGGRTRTLPKYPELDRQFPQVLQEHPAGVPMNANIKWTNLTDT